jgi:hypothetical protein
MPNEFIARNGITSLGNVVVTGSLTATGTINMSGSIASASFASSASNAVSAATASSADNFLARGTITAQTIVVQTITSSVSTITGSTNFGSTGSNTHTFTGSLNLTGSLTVTTTGTELQVNTTGVNLGNTLTDIHNVTGSLRITGSVTSSGAFSGTSAVFSSTVDGTIFNSTSNAFRFSGNNAISLVSLNAQNVVKINAAGYWGTQLVGANDQGILIDNTGKVGVGVNVLSGWDTTLKPIEIGCSGSFYAGFNGLPLIYMGANAYYNGGWKYASSNTSYRPLLADMGNGNFHFLNAQTGSAGSTISWTTLMKLDNSGNVGIGVSSPQSKVDIQNGNIGIYNNTASSNGAQLYLGDMNFPGGAYFNSAPGLGAAYNSGQSVAGDLAFYVYASSAGSRNEAMRIKGGTGNVGIGITSPNGNLEVAAATPIIISGASSSGTLHGLEFRQSNTIDAYIKQLPATGELRLYVGRNSSWGGNMTFWTDTVQRMFISSGGEVRIQGAGGSQTAFSIYDGGTRRFFCIPSQYYGYIFGGQIAANNGKYFSFGNDAGSEVGFIQVTATGVNYTSNSSDIRKKKNFENWEETVLPYFKNINPQKFNYTIEEDGQSKTKGFIAQEMYDKFPEAYPLDLDGFHSFNPGGMVVYLIKAIQELEARVQELENK